MKTIRRQVLWTSVAILGLATGSHGQQPKIPALAPVPAEIVSAQKIFISNAGGESLDTVIDQTVFNGGPDRQTIVFRPFFAMFFGKVREKPMKMMVLRRAAGGGVQSWAFAYTPRQRCDGVRDKRLKSTPPPRLRGSAPQ